MIRMLTIATVTLVVLAAAETTRAQNDTSPVTPTPAAPAQGALVLSTDDVETPNSETASVAYEELFRPLSSVTLANAASTAAIDGTLLTPPVTQVGPFFDSHGQTTWTTGDWIGIRPQRNTFPICYRPLYFEDPNLERCGRSHGCLTELASAAHFFGRIPALPYLLTANCPGKCVRALPDCPSCHEFGCDAYLPPFDAKAAGVETAAVVGLIFLIP